MHYVHGSDTSNNNIDGPYQILDHKSVYHSGSQPDINRTHSHGFHNSMLKS
uniref:Uncharacterized protein n=1 Tax=Arion vulgaris TaxID=1028688 RepID=A0A0B6XYP2_9EUPU